MIVLSGSSWLHCWTEEAETGREREQVVFIATN